MTPHDSAEIERVSESISRKIYVLLVGINDYQGQVPKLSGCLNDVNRVETYLKNQYGDQLNVKKLLDSEATYENIIAAFEGHLVNGEGTEGDAYWFHFSGHGSEQFTANEFFEPKDEEGKALPSLAPNGKDQSLVCYNPNGTMEGIFLADKELAVLIHKLHQKRNGPEAEIPEVIITLDCCHSGTATRSHSTEEIEAFKTRKWEFLKDKKTRYSGVNPEGAVRTLDSYYQQWYLKNRNIDSQTDLIIPTAPHLLISACTNLEEAGDLPIGGLFTNSLLQTITEAKGKINYADLFTRTRRKVIEAASKVNLKQTPQFEPLGDFNAYRSLLTGESMGEPGKFEVLKKGDDWYVKAGAIHGLSAVNPESTRSLAQQAPKVRIYDAHENKVIGIAELGKIGIQDSLIKEVKAWPEAEGAIFSLSDEKTYVADIYSVPAEPLPIMISGEEIAAQALIDNWGQSSEEDSPNLAQLNIVAIPQNPGDSELETSNDTEVEVRASSRSEDGEKKYLYSFVNRLTGKIFYRIKKDFERDTIEEAKKSIHKIARWKRNIALSNPHSIIRDMYALDLLYGTNTAFIAAGRPNPQHAEEYPKFLGMMSKWSAEEGELLLELNDDELFKQAQKDVIPIHLKLRTLIDNKNLYFNTLVLTEDCSIQQYSPPEIHLEKTIKKQEVAIGKIGSLQMTKDEEEAQFWIKILVTGQSIDANSLTQKGFGDTRGGTFRFKVLETLNEWHVTDLKITIRRK